MRPMPITRPRAFVGACAPIALAAALAAGSVAAEPQEVSNSAAPPATSEPQQQPVSPPKGSAEAIALLERIETALGGRAAIEAIPGVRMQMTVRTSEDDPAPTVVSVLRAVPFAARIRQSGGGRPDGEIGFDGEVGWMSDGRGGVLELEAEHARGMMQGADLQAMLRELRGRYERFDLDPPSEFRGKQALVLRCVEEDAGEGDSVRVFVNPATALPMGLESVFEGDSRDVNRVVVDGWRDEGGVKVFSKMTIDRGPVRSIITFDRIAFEAIPAGEIRSPLGETKSD